MRAWAAVSIALLAACCSSSTNSTHSPTSPTSPTSGSSGSGVSGASRLSLDLPIRPGDSANSAYGIWPFGVHGGSHALDGHPGYDFEYRPGSPVLAAADGLVDNVIADTLSIPGAADRFSVQLRVSGPSGNYFISYTNLVAVPPGVTPRAAVSRGQVIGTAGTIGNGSGQPFAMTHFQLNDPADTTPALSNTGAVNPESYFTAAARAELDTIWRTAAYINEWCEPFLGNSRANGFPMRRTWTRRSGDGPAGIEVRCPTDGPDVFEYSLLDAGGAAIETGRLRLGWDRRPTTADFVASTGTTRLGLYDIVSGSMQLALAAASASRPASFAAATVYATP